MKSWWQDIYAFIHQVEFGILDPILNKEIAFYFFSIPFLENLQNWLLLITIITIAIVGWIYFSRNVLLTLLVNKTQKGGIKTHIFLLSLTFLNVFSNLNAAETNIPNPPSSFTAQDHPWDHGQKIDLNWIHSLNNQTSVQYYSIFQSTNSDPFVFSKKCQC